MTIDYSTHYLSGEEIHAGDRVLWAGKPAQVAFVIGRDEFRGDFASQRDWYKQEYQRGFMIECESYGLVLENEADEDIELVAREGSAPPEISR
jgi:hypothetical protein